MLFILQLGICNMCNHVIIRKNNQQYEICQWLPRSTISIEKELVFVIVNHSITLNLLLLKHFLHSSGQFGQYCRTNDSTSRLRDRSKIIGLPTHFRELRILRPRRISSRIHPHRINTNAQVGGREIVGTYGKGALEDKRARVWGNCIPRINLCRERGQGRGREGIG